MVLFLKLLVFADDIVIYVLFTDDGSHKTIDINWLCFYIP